MSSWQYQWKPRIARILTGDIFFLTETDTYLKLEFVWNKKIFEDFWDIVSTQLQDTCKITVQVIFFVLLIFYLTYCTFNK